MFLPVGACRQLSNSTCTDATTRYGGWTVRTSPTRSGSEQLERWVYIYARGQIALSLRLITELHRYITTNSWAPPGTHRPSAPLPGPAKIPTTSSDCDDAPLVRDMYRPAPCSKPGFNASTGGPHHEFAGDHCCAAASNAYVAANWPAGGGATASPAPAQRADPRPMPPPRRQYGAPTATKALLPVAKRGLWGR